MSVEEFHKPFIKSLLVVAFFTMVALVTSHYAINYYLGHQDYSSNKSDFIIHTSQNESNQ